MIHFFIHKFNNCFLEVILLDLIIFWNEIYILIISLDILILYKNL